MKYALMLIFLIVSTLGHAQLTDGSHTLALPESVITWKVDYSLGNKGHAGILKLTSGTILVKKGIISGGNFIIDMNSVHATDVDAKDLDEHLKADDFLATKTHPKGYFTVVNSVRNSPQKFTLSGYLILKGISNTIIVPITLTETKTTFILKSELSVDRTLWGINYQSGSILGALKDDIISDQINITLHLIFKKSQ